MALPAERGRRRGPIAFLFLGETLLIPHLWPIAEAVARRSDVAVDLWVGTSVHEALLARWSAGMDNVRIRRAPGFRSVPGGADGRNPPLPFKPWVLARLAPRLLGTPVAVCAEQTSLWLPTLLPMRTRFVKTAHGAGSMSARADRRRRAAAMTLVPSAAEGDALIRHGVDPATVHVTGYVKAGFRQRTPASALFPVARPTVLYTPHWQAHRSSWPRWGRQVVAMLAAQDRYNVILAPHQRLIETAPEVAEVLAAVANLPHIRVDIDSFAMVDGTYTGAADFLLSDTSSQLLEFLARPRPCVFLNADARDWQGDANYSQWACGQVVDHLDDLLPAIDRAPAVQSSYSDIQRAFAATQAGDMSGDAPERAAHLILGLLI